MRDIDMVSVGETAPDFTLPKAGGNAYDDISEFTLSDELEEGPIVLAFFPAAFTSGCTSEMCAFRDSMHAFNEFETRVYGISVDLPFAQNIWIEQEGLNFSMLSDWGHKVIQQYDIVKPDLYDSIETAQRSILVIDTEGKIIFKWIQEDNDTDFEKLIDCILAEIISPDN